MRKYVFALALAFLGRLEVLGADEREDLAAEVETLRESLRQAIEENERIRAMAREVVGDAKMEAMKAASSNEIVSIRLKNAIGAIDGFAESMDS